jgi:cytochrome c556
VIGTLALAGTDGGQARLVARVSPDSQADLNEIELGRRKASPWKGDAMKVTVTFRPLLAIVALVAVFAVGCAASQSVSIPSSTAVEARQRLMKSNGANWADAQAKFKAGNIEGIAVNAENMALNAKETPGLFPVGSLLSNSKAKSDVWDNWTGFVAAAKNAETLAVNLRDAAQRKDAAATEAIMKDFGAKACGACHTPFRQPAR